MAKRTGVPSMIKVSQRLCGLVVTFSPIIEKRYPSNTALQAALVAALTACQVLNSELQAVREIEPPE